MFVPHLYLTDSAGRLTCGAIKAEVRDIQFTRTTPVAGAPTLAQLTNPRDG